MHYLDTRKKTKSPSSTFMGKTYGDALYSRIGKRYSISCGEADAPGAAYFRHLEGSLPAGGEFVEPFSIQYLP
jgi:hypothetical protein